MLCIARAYKDHPLERTVVEVSGGIAYIAKPSAVELAERLDEIGVRFPMHDLYAHDSMLMDELRSAFNDGDQCRLQVLWDRARPLPL